MKFTKLERKIMDGYLHPTWRKKRRGVFCDLFISGITIVVIEFAIFSSIIAYHCINMYFFYRNGRKNAKDVVRESSGETYRAQMIPTDVMAVFILLGAICSFVLTFLIFFGVFWLFLDMLKIWTRTAIWTTAYFFIILLIDWIFSRYEFSWVLIYLPLRCYFIFLIYQLISQIRIDEEESNYDFEKYEEEILTKNKIKYIPNKEEDRIPKNRWLYLLYAICQCGIFARVNLVTPVNIPDREHVTYNIRRDMDLIAESEESSISSQASSALAVSNFNKTNKKNEDEDQESSITSDDN